jgi:Uma2 family endonuclease
MVVCDRKKITTKGCEGVPDFVVEVINKSTAWRDYYTKFKGYIDYGVKEYWIVDYFKNLIMVYINNGDPPSVNKYTFKNTVKSAIFEGLSVDFKEITGLLDYNIESEG